MWTNLSLVAMVGAALAFLVFDRLARVRNCQPRLVSVISIAGCGAAYLAAGVVEDPRIEIMGWLWGPAQLIIAGVMALLCLPYVAPLLRSLRRRSRPAAYAFDAGRAPRLADDSTLTLLAPVMRAYAGAESVAWQVLPDDQVALTLMDDGVAVLFSRDAVSLAPVAAGDALHADAIPRAARQMRRA